MNIIVLIYFLFAWLSAETGSKLFTYLFIVLALSRQAAIVFAMHHRQAMN